MKKRYYYISADLNAVHYHCHHVRMGMSVLDGTQYIAVSHSVVWRAAWVYIHCVVILFCSLTPQEQEHCICNVFWEGNNRLTALLVFVYPIGLLC